MSENDPRVKHTPRRRGPRGIQTNHAELKRRRLAANLTLDELAEQAGSSKSFLSQVENDRFNAGIDLLHRIAAVLDCPVEDLMNGTGGEAA